MALVFIDGFDHYDPNTEAELTDKWDTASTTSYYSVGTGRSGSGNSIQVNGQYGYFGRVLENPQTEMIFGLAYKIDSYSSTEAWGAIFNTQILDTTPSTYFNLSVDVNGKIMARLGSTKIVTSSYVIPLNTWIHIEARIICHDTTGEVEVRINGDTSPIINETGVDTKGGSYTNINSVYFHALSGVNASFDDIYMLDTTGTVNNDFLGDCAVELLLPDGDEGTNDFTPTGAGTTNADRVDEASADDDTTYLSSSTTSDKDLFTYGNITGTVNSVKGVQITSRMKKSVAGNITVRNLCKHSTTTGNGATIGLSTDYSSQTDMFETNPSTSSAWTETEVNAMSAGLEIVS